MTTTARPTSVASVRAGLIITALTSVFLLFDAVIHLLGTAPVTESFRELGFLPGQALAIGVVELVCVGLYLIPRTSVLGAVLLTGYLGGAVCAHLRVESPLLSTTLFPVYVGIGVWAGLCLRDAGVRVLLGGQK
jgi:DoxX-like protein